MGKRIIGILLSIGLIVAGLSGQFVLRGTNSSTALVVAGIIWLIIDIIGIIKEKNANEGAAEAQFAAPQQVEDEADNLSVEEWQAYFRNLLQTHFPGYSLKENVPVTELAGDVQESFQLYENRPYQVYKAEWGKDYDFVLYSDGKPKAVVMLGDGHCHSTQVTFLISRMFAKKLDVPYLGFYLQFPNKEDYVVGRIKEQLG